MRSGSDLAVTADRLVSWLVTERLFVRFNRF